MDLKRWTDYDRFLVLGDKSNGRLKMSYENFLKFKMVIEALKKIQGQSGHSFALDGKLITNKKVTATEAQNILSNIYKCKWNPVTKKLLLVASQLGISLH